ncbi:MAG TPA: 3-deoxy-D-manno-octulosonic acid transferase [Candidatus Hydrogenedentes bacterium]|nr:3-deoxy-D-manno-octulosonic acid transferase [Candidatus Hydrogenedentota bacterium]
MAMSVAAPIGATWLRMQPARRPLLARFDPPVPPMDGRPLWVQACSMGEVGTAKPLILAFLRRHPDVPVLLTASTMTGHAQAEALRDRVHVSWFPVDQGKVVRRFLDRARPRALVLIETELWPTVIREAARHDCSTVLLNGRISDKHYPRYRRFRPVLAPAFEELTAVGAQNGEYAERLASLGTPRERIRVTGSTKFDGVLTTVDGATQSALRASLGFPDGAPVLVFGSTRPGDEALAATCWKTLRDAFPDLRLVVAPRHLDRLAEVLAVFQEPVLLRSATKAGTRSHGERVIVLDTMGELVAFYALATVAVVGGSFYPGVNGHNPLEPAALGVPTVFGPYMRNFIDPARVLLECRGAVQVPSPEGLAATLECLLRDADARDRLSRRGQRGVLDNQGAIERSLDLLDGVLGLGACETP